VHNAYALQEAKATFEGMRAAAPGRRPFLLTRAGFAGIQRFAAVWTGDTPSTWQALEQTLPCLLNLGLSGVPFVGSDVGGFSGKAGSDLYARWMQLGSLSPFFRCHTSKLGNRQEPWQFGPQVENLARSVIGERYRLLAYLYSLAHRAARTGEPILRPLVYHFQDDPKTHEVGDEAMLGPFLLAAPVLGKGATARRVYLPRGRWYDFTSGTAIDGPATVELAVTLASLPLFARAGAILPSLDPVPWSDYEPPRTLYVDLYPSGSPSSFALYEDDGDGYGYQAGSFSLLDLSLSPEAGGGLCFAIGSHEGNREPLRRRMVVRLWAAQPFRAVELDGRALAAVETEEGLRPLAEGWQKTRDGTRITAAFPESWSCKLRFSP
jgi:alpha-glucosidase